MTKGLTYFPPNTKVGRRIMSAASRLVYGKPTISPEVAAFNAEVDRKKREKKAANRAKRLANPELVYGPGTNTGHGHVWVRPDNFKYYCGGPAMCADCSRDFLKYGESK